MQDNIQIFPTQPKANTNGYFTRRIGNTTYRVKVYYSERSNETLQDKIIRLIRNDSETKKASGQ
jgi:hypothetical protein